MFGRDDRQLGYLDDVLTTSLFEVEKGRRIRYVADQDNDRGKVGPTISLAKNKPWSSSKASIHLRYMRFARQDDGDSRIRSHRKSVRLHDGGGLIRQIA